MNLPKPNLLHPMTMSHSKILRRAVLVAGGGALFGLASSHDSLFGHSPSITSCAAGNGGPHSALRRRSTVGALADVKLRTTMAEERINALRAEMRSIETRIAAAERDIGLSAPKTAALASPMRFRTLLEQRATHTLRELDCTSLVTRLVVRSESDFAMQLADRAGTALNSKQVVFVTPASSWIEWLRNSRRRRPPSPADALDFVGWSEGDIEGALREPVRQNLRVAGCRQRRRLCSRYGMSYSIPYPSCAPPMR